MDTKQKSKSSVLFLVAILVLAGALADFAQENSSLTRSRAVMMHVFERLQSENETFKNEIEKLQKEIGKLKDENAKLQPKK